MGTKKKPRSVPVPLGTASGIGLSGSSSNAGQGWGMSIAGNKISIPSKVPCEHLEVAAEFSKLRRQPVTDKQVLLELEVYCTYCAQVLFHWDRPGSRGP